MALVWGSGSYFEAHLSCPPQGVSYGKLSGLQGRGGQVPSSGEGLGRACLGGAVHSRWQRVMLGLAPQLSAALAGTACSLSLSSRPPGLGPAPPTRAESQLAGRCWIGRGRLPPRGPARTCEDWAAGESVLRKPSCAGGPRTCTQDGGPRRPHGCAWLLCLPGHRPQPCGSFQSLQPANQNIRAQHQGASRAAPSAGVD